LISFDKGENSVRLVSSCEREILLELSWEDKTQKQFYIVPIKMYPGYIERNSEVGSIMYLF